MGPGKGSGQLIFYNCGGLGHYLCYCTNPKRASCLYHTHFDHETEDYPTLIARLRDKGIPQPP